MSAQLNAAMIHSNYQPNYHVHVNQSNSRSDAARNEGDIRALKNEVDRLSIICEALWEMLAERHGLEEIDLVDKMTQIDLRDGKLDGKKDQKEPPRDCPRCKRTLLTDRPICLYCGEVTLPRPFKD